MINAFICFAYLIGPFHAGPYLRSFFLSGVKRAGGKKAGVKGPKIHDFSPSSGVIFSSYFWDHSLITSSETGVWGRGGDADICKCTQIRSTLFVIV